MLIKKVSLWVRKVNGDGIHSEYGALLRYTQDYHKRLSIIRKVLVQEKEMFEGRKATLKMKEVNANDLIAGVVNTFTLKVEKYNAAVRDKSISDLQLVSWLLGECSNVEEVKEAVKKVHVINIDPRASTVHWRFAEPSGRQLVLEIIKGELHFYENTLGVLTNSPSFEWHLTNLNNYVNLFPGTAPNQQLGNIELSSFGAGSGFLGIPGDVTPPSRFVRAAFYQSSAPQQETALETVFQCFQILNNFDIPVGIEFPLGQVPCDIPSATQWTSVTDMRNHVIYYRTMYNSVIRNIDLRSIDFSTVRYRAVSMDGTKRQAVETIKIE